MPRGKRGGEPRSHCRQTSFNSGVKKKKKSLYPMLGVTSDGLEIHTVLELQQATHRRHRSTYLDRSPTICSITVRSRETSK